MMRRGWSRAARRGGGERGGCLLRLMVLLVIVSAAISLAWMALLPVAFTRGLRERTGFPVEIASLSANPFTGRATLRGLVITNPAVFPTTDFLQLRSFEAEVAMWPLFNNEVEIVTLTLDVRQLTLVKRAADLTNLDVFRAALVAGESKRPTNPSVLIRRLRMRFDTLVFVDYTEAKPRVSTYRLGFDQQFSNISSAGQLFVPAVLRGLSERNAASSLADFLPTDLVGLLGGAGKTGSGFLKSAERKANDTFRGFLDKLEETRKP